MKVKKILLSLLVIITLTSCEQTVTNVELPFKEQLVIKCIMDSGDLVDSVLITRTLPPLEIYDPNKALVKDAKVVISDGTNNFELSFANGYYNSSNLIAEFGKTYTLTVEWKGKKATATTFVPNPVEISKIEYEINKKTDTWSEWFEINIFSMIKPVKNVVFNSGYVMYDQGFNSYNFYNISREIDVNSAGFCKVSFFNGYFGELMDTNKVKQFFKDYVYVLCSYDAQFYPYFITRYNGQSGDEIFGGSSNNIQWNIKGDGIGLFLGRSTTYRKI